VLPGAEWFDEIKYDGYGSGPLVLVAVVAWS
jgi:hypothetical protein